MRPLNLVILFNLLGAGGVLAGTEGVGNTFYGQLAGGAVTSGNFNAYFGRDAGGDNTIGFNNTAVGTYAGAQNVNGTNNTFLGANAGFYNTGSNNVFLGGAAGQDEVGSDKLYIANSSTSTPLIYGDFGIRHLTINGNLNVVAPDFGVVTLTDNTVNNTNKGARMLLKHYNNASLPVYLFGAASTPSQNFVAFGGGNIVGSAATQLDFYTAVNNTTASGSPRMTINGVGNIGMGLSSPVHPLQMASGAHVTVGGVWTNASSRDYKENIKDLSTKEAALTLASLTPVTYNYKVDKAQGHVGFIAEDVPELVATKDRKGLSPMDIVAVLTKVTQEQQRAIEEQQKVAQEQQRALQEQQSTITNLAQELRALKQEVRIGRTTALLADQ